jgi:hypothetical protein
MAVRASRLFGVDLPTIDYVTEHESLVENLKEWTIYTNTGAFPQTFNRQIAAAEAKEVAKIGGNITDFMNKNIPNFIKGTKNPFSDSDWELYVKALNKYNPQRLVEVYQETYDLLK